MTKKALRTYWGLDISTHTLRVEGDLYSRELSDWQQRISTHTLRVEGDWIYEQWGW